MEPLTAIGLAGNIIQFIGFASDLISQTKEINDSTKGCANQIFDLEKVYEKLRDLSWHLESRNVPETAKHSTDFAKYVSAIKVLSQSCKKDCDDLLAIISRLKVNDGSKHPWQSFKIALKTVWKARDISELDTRLRSRQISLTLQVCAMTSIHQQRLIDFQLESRRLNLQQSEKFNGIEKILHDVRESIKLTRTRSVDNALAPADIAYLESCMSQIHLSESCVLKEQRVLDSLDFDSRSIRHNAILEAHRQTFSWVFRKPDEHTINLISSNLLTWLEEKDDLFWVSGKPGSSKSTLMKFVADHPETRQLLATWAHPVQAVIASHYFWSAGTEIQKSQKGLLQTILYEIFRHLPHLIQASRELGWITVKNERHRYSWSFSELHRTLQKIAEQESLPVKFCFFIDGLDEHNGDHLDFCLTLQELARSPHIKICVSSRPWNVFEDSLGHSLSSKIYMHELTREDIWNYANCRFQVHPRWNDPDNAAEDAKFLVEDIVYKASGVFLWVFLVTRQLREGLTEHDSLSDLRRRLAIIPTDLEVFFKQILESFEPFYHEKMATSLQISLALREPANVAIYNFHDEEYMDRDYALKLPIQSFDIKRISVIKKRVSRRLNGRCRGLLEVNDQSGHVEFLHRTVMDFLRTRKMADFLSSRTPVWFDANLALLRAFTAYIKTTQFDRLVERVGFAQIDSGNFKHPLRSALTHAKALGKMTSAYLILDELDRCIPMMTSQRQVKIEARNLGVRTPNLDFGLLLFREEIFKDRMVGYLDHVLPNEPFYFSPFEKPALAELVSSIVSFMPDLTQTDMDVKMFQCLFRHGQDPNEPYGDQLRGLNIQKSPWVDLMDVGVPYQHPGMLPIFESLLNNGIFLLMLKHGADPNVIVRHNIGDENLRLTTAWAKMLTVSFIIPPRASYETMYLQVLDYFIMSGASMTVSRNGESHGSEHSACETFFSHLSTSAEPRQLNVDLLIEVVEKLLSSASQADIQIDNYWPVIEDSLPQAVYTRLRKRFVGVEGKNEEWILL